MAFVVRRLTTCFESESALPDIISHLSENGFNPLIREAKRRFYSVFGNGVHGELNGELDHVQWELEMLPQCAQIESGYRQRTHHEATPAFFPTGSGWTPSESRGSTSPIRSGEVFLTPEETGLLYLLLKPELTSGGSGEGASRVRVEIGYLGDDEEARHLDGFAAEVAESVSVKAGEVEWHAVQASGDVFVKLAQGDETGFLSATAVLPEDVELAAILEDQDRREVATVVNRAGGMLAGYLRKRATNSPEIENVIADLIRGSLLTQECVVICRQTSSQINRVRSRDTIDRMAEMGVSCSCGRPIGSEIVEEIFSATPTLQRMLDRSYWMAARLVSVLESLGVPKGRIFLNLSEGLNEDEIGALADVHGTVLMFEIKDGEFSVGHAYAFASRIGLYKPDYAILVSTQGVDGDAKEYFDRVKPQATIVCIDKLEQLTPVLSEIIARLRCEAAAEILSSLDRVAHVRVPLAQVLGSRIGVKSG